MLLSRLMHPTAVRALSGVIRQSSNVPPPRRRFQVPQRENPKLRTHAVSIFHGDYSDDGDIMGADEAIEYEEPDPIVNREALAKIVKADESLKESLRKRWKASQTIIHPVIIDERGRSYGRGGRKTASARVWIQPGLGEVVINQKPFNEYFPRDSHREDILGPFIATRTCGAFDVQAVVKGGGNSGQAGAVRHGIARALNKYNPTEYRPALKRLGFVTRDPRVVERKKIGLVKARKAPTWVRR